MRATFVRELLNFSCPALEQKISNSVTLMILGNSTYKKSKIYKTDLLALPACFLGYQSRRTPNPVLKRSGSLRISLKTD